ncbi:MAG: molybdopterin-binding protein [Ruminococcaceae bacterium]|nr:molybdopterin-binding protein [Oscillospiraceae bacterium]
MKHIKTEDAVGHVLCHDITRIVKDEVKDAAFRKGHVVTEADIPLLLSLGKEHLYVWERQDGMLHEDDAAGILYALCAGEHMQPSPVKEGKIEVLAGADGLLQVDVERLRAVNALGDMMIATRHSNSPVRKGDKLAGTRVIPLVIAEEKMAAAQAVTGTEPLLRLYPYQPKSYAIVTTGTEVAKGRIKDTFTPVIREKLAEYDTREVGHVILADDDPAVTRAVLDFAAQGADMVICTGGMSVDPDDKTPLAIRNTGARIVSYGAPVLPGAMFLLGYLPGNIPVMGLPGCVMYAGRTIFDLVLPRVMAGLPVEAAHLAALGHGGLCLNCPACVFPACAFGSGV